MIRPEIADFTTRNTPGPRSAKVSQAVARVRLMAKALGKLTSEERAWKSSGKAMSAYEYHGHTEAEVGEPA